MNSLTLKQIGVKSVARTVRSRRLVRINSIAAAIGLFGGAAVALFGSLLTGASWFVAKEGARQLLSMTGSVLLFLTIPLIVMAACCLDWLEKDER